MLHRWTSSPRRDPSEVRATLKEAFFKGDARLGQGPTTESIGTRGYRLLKGEACRLGQNHPSIKDRDCAGKKFLGIEEINPDGEVPLPRWSGG